MHWYQLKRQKHDWQAFHPHPLTPSPDSPRSPLPPSFPPTRAGLIHCDERKLGRPGFRVN
ncbi:hypothetical protein MC7420_5295 [Coleofasciculus chthonoplastes PCC 7420]|uniref:Uncharacterized protein n=1 Tax=Coleofasciculus chthonoplastes PCC 7420 TaxID=118168 RepID=B4W567_9CYAN|nr:hypothetical protein MC7420_5295 [Coleofasciculus chthonoplastes PCC 7420]